MFVIYKCIVYVFIQQEKSLKLCTSRIKSGGCDFSCDSLVIITHGNVVTEVDATSVTTSFGTTFTLGVALV